MKNLSVCVLVTILLTSGCQQTEDSERLAADWAEEESGAAAIPVAQAEPADLLDLRLRLSVGDRFPLIKSVRQSVQQQSAVGAAQADTELELHLVLTVKEITETSVMLDVWYSRVKFTQDGQGRRTVYDSMQPPRRLPYAAVPFSGLTGNGYAVRIGRDNQIQELIGHDEFMARCMARVPEDRRQTLMNEIAVRFGDEGVAGFIPDTLGLLPFDAKAKLELASCVQEGDSWKYERHMMQPVPVNLKSTCRVVRTSNSRVEIDIAGRVTRGKTYSGGKTKAQGAVSILGGTTSGVCIVDRRSGLPVDVKRTEILQIMVAAADGSEIRQDKRIDTQVRMFPEERGPVVQAADSNSGVVPVAAEAPQNGSGVQQIPTQAR